MLLSRNGVTLPKVGIFMDNQENPDETMHILHIAIGSFVIHLVGEKTASQIAFVMRGRACRSSRATSTLIQVHQKMPNHHPRRQNGRGRERSISWGYLAAAPRWEQLGQILEGTIRTRRGIVPGPGGCIRTSIFVPSNPSGGVLIYLEKQ